MFRIICCLFLAVIFLGSVDAQLGVGYQGELGINFFEEETAGGGNITTFLELLDTPNSYVGEGGNCVLVKVSEDGLEFGSCGTGGGGNTTEEIQDAVGSGFTGNLSYDDAGNKFDVDSTNLLSWLDNIYAKLTDIVSLVGNWSEDKPNYFNKTDILGFSYYNLTNFDINDYYLKSNPFGFWNDTYSTFNKTYADTLYYNISNPYGFLNTTTSMNQTQLNTTFLKLSGGNLTGNLNISSANLTLSDSQFICLNQACSRWIKSNSSGVFIQG